MAGLDARDTTNLVVRGAFVLDVVDIATVLHRSPLTSFGHSPLGASPDFGHYCLPCVSANSCDGDGMFGTAGGAPGGPPVGAGGG